MAYVVWFFRLCVFLIILLFALKNTTPVDVTFFVDSLRIELPLVVLIVVSLVLGALCFGVFIIPGVLRRRREISRLRNELEALKEQLSKIESADEPVDVPLIMPIQPI